MALLKKLDLKDTSYEHGGGKVSFAGTLQSHTDCSGFIDTLCSIPTATTRRNSRHGSARNIQPLAASRFAEPKDEELVIGRLKPMFKP